LAELILSGFLRHRGIKNNKGKIPTIHSVLNELQKRRGKGKAHGSWDTPGGSLIGDSNRRLQDVIDAIEELITVLESIETLTRGII
jgi:hypothetical protein